MNIISINFYIYIILLLTVYYIVSNKYKKIIILLSSLYFIYINSSCILFVLFLLITFIAWCGALLIEKTRTYSKKIFYFTAITLIAILFYCKDLEFLNVLKNIYNVLFNNIFNSFEIKKYGVVSLIGISYFTLSLIGYVFDVYWEKYKAEKKYFNLLLFSSYFPSLITGPINKYDEFRFEIQKKKSFDIKNIIFGLERIIWGLYKKLVIADRAAIYVNAVFDYNDVTGIFVVFAIILYSIELYTDFSGCIDICLGVSECFNIILPENFNTPFASIKFAEFWRRWHITMGNWFKEYVLYPIMKSEVFQKISDKCRKIFGKKYGKKLSTCLALSMVWIIIGIWHGGSITYILCSGILPGILLIIEELLEDRNSKKDKIIKDKCKVLYSLLQNLRIFIIMSLVWTIMRSDGLYESFNVVIRIFDTEEFINVNKIIQTFNNELYISKSIEDIWLDGIIIFISTTILIIVGIIHEKRINIREKIYSMPMIYRWIIFGVLIMFIAIFGHYGPEYNVVDFIYKEF